MEELVISANKKAILLANVLTALKVVVDIAVADMAVAAVVDMVAEAVVVVEAEVATNATSLVISLVNALKKVITLAAADIPAVVVEVVAVAVTTAVTLITFHVIAINHVTWIMLSATIAKVLGISHVTALKLHKHSGLKSVMFAYMVLWLFEGCGCFARLLL